MTSPETIIPLKFAQSTLNQQTCTPEYE